MLHGVGANTLDRAKHRAKGRRQPVRRGVREPRSARRSAAGVDEHRGDQVCPSGLGVIPPDSGRGRRKGPSKPHWIYVTSIQQAATPVGQSESPPASSGNHHLPVASTAEASRGGELEQHRRCGDQVRHL